MSPYFHPPPKTGERCPHTRHLVLHGAWRARRHVLQKVARFIAPSPAIARSLKDSGFPADRIGIIPHGLPQGDFVVRPPQPISERRGVHLLCVGRLVPNKGVQYLLEALLQVRQVQPDVILTVAGDGAHRPELERLCASLGLTATVRFIGAQSRSALSDLYAKADLMVFPSLSEVFPYVALEAAATGIPVVATSVGGVPEILGDGAFLVPPMDPEALAEGILTALSDRAAAAARAKLAQERYVARFDSGRWWIAQRLCTPNCLALTLKQAGRSCPLAHNWPALATFNNVLRRAIGGTPISVLRLVLSSLECRLNDSRREGGYRRKHQDCLCHVAAAGDQPVKLTSGFGQ